MDAHRLDLLDPWEVARLGDLEFQARGVVEGFLTGQHRSPLRGFSVEFAEHRPYQPGDDLRYVDWKVLGRSNRLAVKQFESETNLRAMLLLDASASMAWSGAPDRLSKLAYAQRLAAALGLVLLGQRDATGVIAFDDAVRLLLPARAHARQRLALLTTLAGVTPGTGTAAADALARVSDLLRRRGLVVLLSDLLIEQPLVLRLLQYLRHRGHQVLVFHVMDPAERELAGPPEARFEDPETGRTVVVRPREFRAAYGAAVHRAIEAWRTACRRNGIGYAHVTTDTPFGTALRQALARRARLG